MQTLAELQAGAYKGITHLTLSQELTSFPLEILDLADTLEFLDLSNNRLSELPQELGRFKRLQTAFFSNNLFTHIPSCFKACEKLSMLGFKANKIAYFEEDILPESISWLILTDNQITSLPASIGKLKRLRKFPLAGNQLTSLPPQMSACTDLELLRLSANQLTHIPSWLLGLPKLSWLAFSGNPCSTPPQNRLQEVAYDSLELSSLLGQGASGEIFKGYAPAFKRDVAVKRFKGAVTSDGYAKDEMQAFMNTGSHPNLIKVLAKVKDPHILALILELIPDSYENLGFPPDFTTCTRDTFKEGTRFDIHTVYAVAQAMVSVSAHLHAKGMMHGDLYAHNILLDKETNHSYLGDFGAATFYDPQDKRYEKIEVRAFGCLLEDLLKHTKEKKSADYTKLSKLSQQCMDEDIDTRPLFRDIVL